ADLSLLALGTLDPEERRDIEQHVAGCTDCQQQLASWREVVGLVALDAQDAMPPDLKPQLLQRVGPSNPRAKVIALRRWVALPLAAAAALLLGLGIIQYTRVRTQLSEQLQLAANLRTELGTSQSNLQRLTQELAAHEKDLTSLRAALAAAQESLAIVQDPGLRMVALKQTPEAQPAEAHALISSTTRRALFYAFDLPQPPTDKAYELWWITEKEGPVNAGVFHPDTRGLGRVEAQVPTGAGAIQAAAVTIEPAAGVAKPTGPMVLLGKL
ncbi:MAG: anti-sigma factor domain-containing protein, partial [Gaiellaceae bacterium]